eukprot:1018276-Pyramimonas_sp.AAC.1
MVNFFTELELQSSSRTLRPKNQKDITRREASRRLVWVCCERRRQTGIRTLLVSPYCSQRGFSHQVTKSSQCSEQVKDCRMQEW